jgi:hypothetical protein
MRTSSTLCSALLLVGLAWSPLGCGSSEPAPTAEPPAGDQDHAIAEPTPAPPKIVKPLAAPTATPRTTDDLAATDTGTDSATDTPTAGEPASDKPANVDGVLELLLARHADDLPDKATLDSHDRAPAALRWIATHDERLITQARALEALGFWPDDSNRDFLLAAAVDAKRPVKSRAAAWKGLAAWDLKGDVELLNAATEASADPAVPIARAAQAALGL